MCCLQPPIWHALSLRHAHQPVWTRATTTILDSSHVLPALLRKTHEAKLRGDKKLEIWGTGKPRREFLYVDDMADACVFLMERSMAITKIFPGAPLVNIGTGTDVTIAELAASHHARGRFRGRSRP